MSTITCYNSSGEPLRNLVQWDVNQTITVRGITTPPTPVFHFCNRNSDVAYVVPPTASANGLTAPVPNILLQEAEPIIFFLYSATTNDGHRTIYTNKFPVLPRPRPSDYEYEEDIDYDSLAELQARVEGLEEAMREVQAMPEPVPVYGMGDNLLRNWYFVGGGTGHGVFPVNQQGATSYSQANATAIDGWGYGVAPAPVSINANGVLVSVTAQSQSFNQNVDVPPTFLLGQKFTASILDASGVLYSGTGTFPTTIPSATTVYLRVYIPSFGQLFVSYASSTGRFTYSIGYHENAGTGVSKAFVAAKLELGEQQTLAHNEGTTSNPVWVLNEAPDYEMELLRCQTATARSADTLANKSIATEQEIVPYIETGTTASRAYQINEYFCWRGLMYRTLMAVASGDTWAVGTNCVAVTVGRELSGFWGRDWFPNGKSMFSVPKGIYRIAPNRLPSEGIPINQYGALLVGGIGYPFIVYINTSGAVLVYGETAGKWYQISTTVIN